MPNVYFDNFQYKIEKQQDSEDEEDEDEDEGFGGTSKKTEEPDDPVLSKFIHLIIFIFHFLKSSRDATL